MLEDDYWCAVGAHVEQHGRHHCLCDKFRHPVFRHTLRSFRNFVYQNGFSPLHCMARSRQYLDGFNNVTRIIDVLWNDSRYKCEDAP